jgi:hypothetical protein
MCWGGDGDDESMMAMAATGVEQWCYHGEINNEWWIDILCPTPVLRILFFLPAFCPHHLFFARFLPAPSFFFALFLPAAPAK